MSEIFKEFDTYGRRAQLYPALLTFLPLAAAIVLLWPGLELEKLGTCAVALGVPFFLMNIVRGRGQRLEGKLVRQWAGMPTTHLLRNSTTGGNRVLRDRRRAALEKLVGGPLPTLHEERVLPSASDERYTAATRVLITRVREQSDRYPLVREELTKYGFWRNLLALRPIAFIVLAGALTTDGVAFLAGRDPQVVGVAALIHVCFLLSFLLAVSPKRVFQQGETYAERLFETLETIGSHAPAGGGGHKED
ncbi:hypothetical protein [Pseudonocardia sp. NPDC049154]|uniref:hypothetical protein n=1 Tax=Pseudonocardia sp. NPDC049154 TaxID=3155501 RepID=UPI0033D73819